MVDDVEIPNSRRQLYDYLTHISYSWLVGAIQSPEIEESDIAHAFFERNRAKKNIITWQFLLELIISQNDSNNMGNKNYA